MDELTTNEIAFLWTSYMDEFNPKSPGVGRAQGMYVTAGLDGLNSHVMISIVFRNKEYNGSTIQIQGISQQFVPGTEVAVVAGTGKFRFARGYATFETYFLDIPTQYSVIRFNVTVQHHYLKMFMGSTEIKIWTSCCWPLNKSEK
ncbi:dirigent protein 23 [Quercus suber]|uniref:Dirigent protein n=1 Tax=Quercus suber TaxID=58331 RepID=A0AAW0LMI9_QUESU